MPELIELTAEELDNVTGGVSFTGGNSLAFSTGVGTTVTSSATLTTSTVTATNGGTYSGASSAGPNVLAQSPPGS